MVEVRLRDALEIVAAKAGSSGTRSREARVESETRASKREGAAGGVTCGLARNVGNSQKAGWVFSTKLFLSQTTQYEDHAEPTAYRTGRVGVLQTALVWIHPSQRIQVTWIHSVCFLCA